MKTFMFIRYVVGIPVHGQNLANQLNMANKPLMMWFLTISDADLFLQQFVNDKLSHCSCQGSQLLLDFG